MEDMISQLIQDYCACLNEWNAAYEDYAKSVELNFTSLSIPFRALRYPKIVPEDAV